MTEYIEHAGRIIVASTDVELLKAEHNKGLPILLVLNEDNRDKDTSFARFAITEECVLDDKISRDIDDYFLDRIIARSDHEPCVLFDTDRLIVRELSVDDVEILEDIFNESSEFIDAFFESREDLKSVISKYAEEIYDFYGYGLWAICLRESGMVIGIAGLTLRNENRLELGYALLENYRHKGYCYEACYGILQYAKENIESSGIFARVDSRNAAGIKLADKLGIVLEIIDNNIEENI